MKKIMLGICILAVSFAVFSYASRRAFLLQVQLIEAHCEKEVARSNILADWPKEKVCEVIGSDIVTEVAVKAGKYSRMECDEILWPLSQNIIETCNFMP